MKLLGFNFIKISVEKFKEKTSKIQISTNIDISEIKQTDSELINMKDTILGIQFTYTVTYSPEIADLSLGGNILVALEEGLAKEVLKEWKDKKLPENFKISLFNFIMKKSSLKALQLEEEIGLPLHIPLPSLKPSPKEDSDKKDK